MSTALQSQVNLMNGLYLVSDFYDQRKPEFRDRLAAPIRLERKLPPLFQGIQGGQEVQFRFKNVGHLRATAPGEATIVGGGGGGFGLGPAGQTPAGLGGGDTLTGTVLVGREKTSLDVTMTDIVAGRAGIVGKPASAAFYDLDSDTEVFRMNGVIVSANDAAGGPTGLEEGVGIINVLDLQAFQELIPRVRLMERFPKADLADVAGQDVPVFVVFGPMRKVRLAYLGFWRQRYWFGAFRTPLTGTFTWVTVYRNKAVVPPSQYVTSIYAGCQVVGFSQEQVDGSGRRFDIRADVTSSEFVRPSDAGEFILSDPTYGLGLSVDAASFTAAASAYTANSYSLFGGLTQRTQAQTVLNKLALRGAVIDRTPLGKYTWTVDTLGLHTDAPVKLGLGDRRWQNVISILSKGEKRLEEKLKRIQIQGLYDPGFEGNGSYLMTATRADKLKRLGVELTVEPNEFIGTDDTLDRECDYRFKTLIHGEQTLRLKVQVGTPEVPCGRALDLNHLVEVDIPALRMDSTTYTWKVEELAIEPDGIEVGFRHYDPSIFSYTPRAVEIADNAAAITDYSFTLPTTPPNFSVPSSVFVTAGDGTKSAIATLEADAPAVNVTHLMFQVFRNTSAVPLRQREIKVTPGQLNVQAAFNFPVGVGADNTYDLQVFARNVGNVPDFRDGTVAQILNYVVGTDTTPASVPQNLTLTVGTGKSLTLKYDPSTGGVNEYQIYRASLVIPPGDPIPVPIPVPALFIKVGEIAGTVFVDTEVTIGTYYWYKVRSIDRSENPSAFSTVAGPAVPLHPPPDPTPPGPPVWAAFPPGPFVSSATYQASDGHTKAIITLTMPAMPTGAAFMNALYRLNTSSAFKVANQRNFGGGLQQFDDLTPGLNYVFALQAFSASTVGSAIVVAPGGPYLAPGDSTAPATVTGLTLVGQPPRSIRARWNAGTEDDLSYYEVQRWIFGTFVPSNPATYVLTEADTNEFTATGLINGTNYSFRVRAKDYTGNPTPDTGWSTVVSLIVPRTASDDIGDDTLETAHYKNASITSLKVGVAEIKLANMAQASVGVLQVIDATMTNAKIVSVSAGKITTGTLIVEPGLGADAILIKNSGRLLLQSDAGITSKMLFQSSGGTQQAEFSCDGTNVFLIPSSNGGMNVRIGSSSNSWNSINLRATDIDIVVPASNHISLQGRLWTDQVVVGAPGGTLNKFVQLYTTAGVAVGRLAVYS